MSFRKIILFTLTSLTLLSFQQTVFSAEYKPFTDSSQLPGQYYLGDGLGVNQSLKLTKENTFTFEWKGCMGTYDENEGPYSLKEGILVLSPKRHNIRKGFKGTPTRFLPLNWGPRLYLIPEKEVLDFVNEINQGREPRNDVHGQFYLREGDEKKPVEGSPILPAQWQDYLLQKQVEGKVIKVEGRKAVINIGKKHGLRKGMVLTARNAQDTRFAQLKVISVDEETSRTEKFYQDDQVQADDIVSTRFYVDAQ